MRELILKLLFPKTVSLKQFHDQVSAIAVKHGYSYVCVNCEILHHKNRPKEFLFTASITRTTICHRAYNKLTVKECLEELEQKALGKFTESKIKEVLI